MAPIWEEVLFELCISLCTCIHLHWRWGHRGFRVFWVLTLTLNCLPRSTLICQSCAVPRRPAWGFQINVIWCFDGLRCLLWLMVIQMVSATTFSTSTMVATFAKCFGASAEDVLQSSASWHKVASCWCFSLALREGVRWARCHILTGWRT